MKYTQLCPGFCRICEVVHASIQLWSKQNCLEKTTPTWGEGGLFIEHLTVHIQAHHCMSCDVWLSTYRHIIAWAVTSGCPHTGMSLHGDYGGKCYYYSTSPSPPSRVGSGLLNLAGCVGVIWTMSGGGLSMSMLTAMRY